MDGVNEPDKNGKISNFWIQMRKNKPLNESFKTGQTSRTKMAFYSFIFVFFMYWYKWAYRKQE
ncbi:hypothetical protein Hanom_Chr04g00348331 [Helianthus anomalus]